VTPAPITRRARLKARVLAVARVAGRRPELLEVTLVFAAVVAVWGPFLASARVNNGLSDWAYRTNYVAYGLNAIFSDHQLPYWATNPDFEQYRMKGVHDFFANPETDVLSLVTPLAKIWDVLTAVKIAVVACLALGVWGCRRLLVVLGGAAGLLPLLIASLLALCNGAFVGHILAGHTQFMATATFPLTLALMLEAFDPALRAATRCLRACLSGALLAMAYYSGAAHPLFYFILGFGVLVPLFTVLVAPRRFLVVVPSALLVGVSFVALAAWKLLPGVVDFSGYQCNYHGVYASFHDFATELVIPWSPVGHGYHHETNFYVGWIGVGLLTFAILGLRDRRSIPLLLACFAMASLMFLKGDSRVFSLPLIRTQGAFQRLRFVLIQGVAVVAATQIQSIVTWIRRRPRRSVRVGVVAVLAALSVCFAFDLWRTAVRHQVNAGCLDRPPQAKGPFDSAPELVPVDRRSTRVEVGRVKANQFEYEYWTSRGGPASLRAPSLRASPRAPHLKLAGDGEIVMRDGILTVNVTGAHGRFVLSFADPLTSWSLTVTLLGLLGLAALGLVARRAGRVRARPPEAVQGSS
jgi:hypothetical protein